jgi:hypothetical protein
MRVKRLGRKRFAAMLAGVASVAVTGLLVSVPASASSGGAPALSQATVLNCFNSHRLSHPFASLAEAQTCVPGAPVFTVSPTGSGGVPSGFTGAAVTQSGQYFTAHYFSQNTLTAPAGLATTSTSCWWRFWNNFNTDNWNFGSAGGTYTPTLEAHMNCFYTYGVANNFYVNWAAYAWPTWQQGTFDSNWANSHGYGYWGTDWVNGGFEAVPNGWLGFWCRGELYANGTSYNYPGCNIS